MARWRLERRSVIKTFNGQLPIGTSTASREQEAGAGSLLLAAFAGQIGQLAIVPFPHE